MQRQMFAPDDKLQDVVTFICKQYHLSSENFELLQVYFVRGKAWSSATYVTVYVDIWDLSQRTRKLSQSID